MKHQLEQNLDKNLAVLDSMFGDSIDYYAKRVSIQGCAGAILMFDGISSLSDLWQVVLDAVSRGSPFRNSGETVRQAAEPKEPQTRGEEIYEILMHRSDIPAESGAVEDFEEIIKRLTAGLAVLLLDGSTKGLAFSVQSLKYRSVSEPAAEGNIRGSREGFTELLRVNISLLRRLIRTPQLVIEAVQAHTAMATEYALCYDRRRADPGMLAKLKKSLDAAKPEMLLDSSYFVPWIDPRRLRLFTPVGYTERPAVAAAKICEGKVILLVNGSPSAMILPYLFAENFECLDDYGQTAYFASFIRILKYCAFYLTVFLPGAFVCAAVYLPELIPPELLYKIQAAEQATPLPLFAEMVMVVLLLEVIREAGLRMPQSLGHSVSLVAALIIGDAAISAGIMSTPVIIVAAITSIALFVVPSLYEPATVLRLAVTLAAGAAGPVGLVFAALVFFFELAQVSLYGVPYLALARRQLHRDGITRENYRRLSRRPFVIGQMKHR